MYDELRIVDCRDAETLEQVEVLTSSDITVTIDLRFTYSADCGSKESLDLLINEVPSDSDNVVRSGKVYELYVLPIVRESLRNFIADITIEDIKKVRLGLRNQVREDLINSIEQHGHPVNIKIVAVSNIRLPQEIVQKNREIELARQDAELQTEKQKTAKVRLERELFEAQQDRLVQREQAEKSRDVKLIDAEADKRVQIIAAEADRDAKRLEAEGMKAVRAQLSRDYVEFVRVNHDADVAKAQANALGKGTVYYLGQDFLVPPGQRADVAVGK